MRTTAIGLAAALLLNVAAAHAAPVIAIIVAPGSGETGTSLAALGLIYEKKRVYWGNGTRIQPVNLPPSSPERTLLTEALFDRDVAAMDDYWRERYFHGVRPPFVVASAEAMLRLVSDTPAAIGYVDACLVDARVRVLGYLNASRDFSQTRPALECRPASR